MRILDIALKDLLQTAKDKMTVVFLVLMPIVFTIFFGLIFPDPAEDADNRLPLAYLNQDGGSSLSQSLTAALSESSAVRLEEISSASRAETLTAAAKGDYAGFLEVPAGFGEQLFTGEPVSLVLIVDEADPQGIAVRTAVQTGVGRVLAAGEAARLAAGNVAAAAPFTGEGERRDFLEGSFTAALEAWKDAPVTLTSQVLQTGKETLSQIPTGYAQSSPGILLQFAIFGLMIPGGVLVSERNSRTMQRLMTTPASRAEIMAGHGLAFTAIIFLQEFILIALGQAFLGLDYLRQPLAILIIMVCLAVMAACLGMLIGITAKKEEQVILYSLVAMFILAAMGGAWFPLEVTGPAFSSIGRLLPSAWAMQGFQNIIVRGLGLESVLLPGAILLGYALVFISIAIWRFSRQ